MRADGGPCTSICLSILGVTVHMCLYKCSLYQCVYVCSRYLVRSVFDPKAQTLNPNVLTFNPKPQTPCPNLNLNAQSLHPSKSVCGIVSRISGETRYPCLFRYGVSQSEHCEALVDGARVLPYFSFQCEILHSELESIVV